ncbi:hypothetical protein [Methylocystis sp. S23]|jgi:hypothetical protein
MRIRAYAILSRRFGTAYALGAGLGLFLAVHPALSADDAAPAEAAPAVPAVEPQAMKGYVDPATGKVSGVPPAGVTPPALSEAEKNAVSTSSEGLREVRNTGPGGGYKVDLQGRFRSPLVGEMEASGQVKAYHPHQPFATNVQ